MSRRHFNQGFPFASPADLENRFSYHRPEGEHIAQHETLRALTKAVAAELVRLIPPGRELACALTKMEELSFWAHAGIARCELVPWPTEEGGPEQPAG